MSCSSFFLAVCLLVGACNSGTSPELRVLGLRDNADAQHVVFVQVTNPASHAMRLTKLEYSFAASGTTVSTGELSLSRDVPADSTVVVEVPLDTAAVPPEQTLKLEGKLTAEQDEIVQTYRVEADVAPPK
jgi:hypothetical protein